jgi:hypothetical protein
MPLHWSPLPHFCKVYKIQAPKHDKLLDSFGSNILSVVYAHQDLCKTNTYCKASSNFLQQVKITEYLQLFNMSMPFSLLDTINKCKLTPNFTAGNYLNLPLTTLTGSGTPSL